MNKPKKRNKKEDDALFEAFLHESISSEDSVDTARVMKFLEPKKESILWGLQEDEDDDEDIVPGLTGTGQQFIKKKDVTTAPLTESNQKVNNSKQVTFPMPGHEVQISRDSLDDDSYFERTAELPRPKVPVPALSLGSSQSFTETMTADKSMGQTVGAETLAELKDKEKFFEELEKNSNGTLNFERLNSDLDKGITLQESLDKNDDQRFHKVQTETESDRESDNPYAARETKRTAKTKDDDLGENSEDRKLNMLSKVELLGSLDSTLGTKAAASKDTNDDMKTIPEMGKENSPEDGGKDIGVDDDEVDGSIADDEVKAAKIGTDNTATVTGRGTAFKTVTGLACTDTSQDLEAVHQAMRQVQVGMETFDSTKDFTFKDSTGVGRSTQSTRDTTRGTAPFGMLPVVPPRTGSGAKKLRFTPHGLSGLVTDLPSDLTARSNEEGTDISPLDELGPHQNGGLVSHVVAENKKKTERSIPTSETKETKKRKGKYTHIRSSGYGEVDKRQRNVTSKKPPWSPATTAKQKVTGYERINKKKEDLKTTSSVADSQLYASVQSFATYIQQHFTDPDQQSSPQVVPGTKWVDGEVGHSPIMKLSGLEREKLLVKEVQEWQEQWKDERKSHNKTKAVLADLEREFQRRISEMKLEHDHELSKHKQENFVLSSKIVDSETSADSRRKMLEKAALETVDKEQLLQMEKEIREQENLLTGYQQENKRLYEEIKKIQTMSKTTEERMFKENQKMSTDIQLLREELQRKEVQLKNKGLITSAAVQQQIAAGNMGTAVLGAGKIAQLEAELKQAKSREGNHSKEVEMLRQTKKELEQQIEELVKMIGSFEDKVKTTEANQSQVSKEVRANLEKEIDKLNRKLKWYAENQELLDRDAEKLKQKDLDIKKLKLKVEELQSESGRKMSEAKTRQKERTADAKRIQDLERQVKEMENIIRKRHPNSLPVLMWAASAASDNADKKSPSVQFLENRIRKLEEELAGQDDEGKVGLRVLEQKYNSMKLQYEERIKSLESDLAKYNPPDDINQKAEHPYTHSVALQKELDSVRERYKKKVAELEQELDQLKKEVSTLKAKETAAAKLEDKKAKGAESELQLRVKALQLEISNHNKETALLQKTIERLQKEKQQFLMDAVGGAVKTTKVAGKSLEKKLQKGKGGKTFTKKTSPREENSDVEPTSLPPYPDMPGVDKQYEPQTFAGQHISDIYRENEDLKIEMDRHQLEFDKQRINLQKLLAEAEFRERKIKEEIEEQMQSMKNAHQAETQRILADHALQHSASRVAQLMTKVDTQEVVVKHLKERLEQAEVDGEKLGALKIREAALETQVKQLIDDLREAKKSHTPEMRHFESLQEKITRLEARRSQRERELQQIINQSQASANATLNSEIQKWKRIVEMKNREIETFRSELDSILEVLRELQRQGVVMPSRNIGVSLR